MVKHGNLTPDLVVQLYQPLPNGAFMEIIKISVENKIARLSNQTFIVCNNTDYSIDFSFDEEWNEYNVKTARFIYNGKHQDVVFDGNICKVPLIENTQFLSVGVFSGELKTTTPAYINCKYSILQDGTQIKEPNQDVYAQIMELLNKYIEQGSGSGGINREEVEKIIQEYLTQNPVKDGFSPTVEITEIDNGHRVTITDINGEKSFDVFNGKDGESGSGGEKGTVTAVNGIEPDEDGNVEIGADDVGAVEKITTSGNMRVYGVTANGSQTTINIMSEASNVGEGKLPRYRSNTRQNELSDYSCVLPTGTPLLPWHATNKEYVDDEIAELKKELQFGGTFVQGSKDYEIIITLTDYAKSQLDVSTSTITVENGYNSYNLEGLYFIASEDYIFEFSLNNDVGYMSNGNKGDWLIAKDSYTWKRIVVGSATPTTEKYELIEKIIIGYSITTAQPDDWETNYTDYFTNTGTDREPIYTAVTGDTVPTWQVGKYYRFTNTAQDLYRDTETDGTRYKFNKLLVYLPKFKSADAQIYIDTGIIINPASFNVYEGNEKAFVAKIDGDFLTVETAIVGNGTTQKAIRTIDGGYYSKNKIWSFKLSKCPANSIISIFGIRG